MSRVFYTSDTHFGHAAIVGYCNRPFRDVDHMNEELVRRWNERVAPEDLVYHLGDFAMGPSGTAAKWRAKLNGRITLVLGNHERSYSHMVAAGFEIVARWSLVVSHPVYHLVLQHRPPRKGQAWLGFFLHGHVHGTYARRGAAINVGVDVRGFAPATLEELIATEDECKP